MRTATIHIRKRTKPDFEQAAEQFRGDYRSESMLSPVMVACFLARFGKTAEVREQAEKDIAKCAEFAKQQIVG